MITDLGNPESFPQNVQSVLHQNRALIRSFLAEERRRDEQYQIMPTYVPNALRETNPHKGNFQHLVETDIASLVVGSRVRVWHYTRLTDSELDDVCQYFRPASMELLSDKIEKAIQEGHIAASMKEDILENSPLVTQSDIRTGRVYAVSVPLPTSDPGVELLLAHWGGEITYFHQQNSSVLSQLRTIGRARVIELSTSVCRRHSYSVAKSMVMAYGKALGCQAECTAFDFVIDENFQDIDVLCIHTEGDQKYAKIGI